MGRFSIPIFKAVAYHPTMLFVPMELAGINVALHVMLMLLFTAVLHVGPLPLLGTAVAVHAAMAAAYGRDMHIVSLARAVGPSRKSSNNIVKITKGVKYVP